MPSVNTTPEKILKHIQEQMLDPQNSRKLYRLMNGGDELTDPDLWEDQVDDIIFEMSENKFIIVNELKSLVGS
ncbi:hypothetical protein [Pelagibaculum spongiae]|uniref:Uncharacterized protein n=1 Tax=Pelagibaculum spongiae TaxID=2080658 RepID=A0A2V1GTS2_9GAMM|nr:hypothetical protein [Pelagibaculum spongiae]PVZ69018.1 hypothetical protein DC094_12300 [Pelagibaculum spongiae]